MEDLDLTITETKSLKLFTQRIPEEWSSILAPDLSISNQLDKILQSLEENIKPSKSDIFEFARITKLDNVCGLIIGQDPYDTEYHAHGLAFSSYQNKTPASLQNIFKALIKSNLIPKKPSTNNLTGWAAQGILLMNTALTVIENKPKSHSKLWEAYMDGLFERLSSYFTKLDKKIIVMLWGKSAEKYESTFKNHIILKYHHPSPLAGDFSDCPNFTEFNSIAKNKINWDPDSNTWIEAYTDGSTYPNVAGPDASSGYAIVFTVGSLKSLKLYGKTENQPPYYTTNIRAEGSAILQTLKYVKRLPVDQRRMLRIVSDSEFWINAMTIWIKEWIKNGIEGLDKHKNPDLVKEVWDAYNLLINDGTHVVFTHVQSHVKQQKNDSIDYYRSAYNRLVDAIANYSRVTLKNGELKESYGILKVDGMSI